jgi:KEOPS complex subunit Cgi121
MSQICLVFGKPKINDKDNFLAALRDINSKYRCTVQALDAEKVVSEKHAIFAAKKALRAFREGRNVAKDLGVEILRYASGERQINRALFMGISKATERVALIAVSNNGLTPDLSNLIDVDELGCNWKPSTVIDAFNISEEEIFAVGEARIPDIVLERVALVDAF